MSAYGVPSAEARLAATPEDAAAAAGEFGRPVAVKAIAPRVAHRSDIGGVLVDVDGPAAAERAARDAAAAVRGAAVELLGDVTVRPAPLGRRGATEMIRSLRSFPLLDGYRGRARADVAAVEDVLLRISALGAANPQIAEIDCDPVLAGPHGATVVDARVRVEPAAATRPFPALDR